MLALVIDVTGYNELRELYCEEGITSVSTNRPQANSLKRRTQRSLISTYEHPPLQIMKNEAQR